MRDDNGADNGDGKMDGADEDPWAVALAVLVDGSEYCFVFSIEEMEERAGNAIGSEIDAREKPLEPLALLAPIEPVVRSGGTDACCCDERVIVDVGDS